MAHLVAVILSGGAGSRLWPVSREALPKPFIKLADGETLLLKALRRALQCAPGGPVLTVTNRDYFFLTRDEYARAGGAGLKLDYLLEPLGRNTAPAICAAALAVAGAAGAGPVLVGPPAPPPVEGREALAQAGP